MPQVQNVGMISAEHLSAAGTDPAGLFALFAVFAEQKERQIFRKAHPFGSILSLDDIGMGKAAAVRGRKKHAFRIEKTLFFQCRFQ
jgi:hypothetical protein